MASSTNVEQEIQVRCNDGDGDDDDDDDDDDNKLVRVQGWPGPQSSASDIFL